MIPLNISVLQLRANSLLSSSPMFMKTGNIFMKNSYFNKFSSNIIYANSYFNKLNIVSSKFSNGLSAPIKISSENYENKLYFQQLLIETGTEHLIKDCYFYKIISPFESALMISIETSQNISLMHSTFYECSSVKAPGSISLDSKTNAYITNVCIQKSQTSVEDVPIFLLRPGFSYAADQVSISDSICNGSMINFESNSQNNKKFKNLNVSHCNSHVTIYSLYTGEDLQNGIFVNNNVTDFLLSFIYDFKMNSIFVTGNSAKDILSSVHNHLTSQTVFFRKIFSVINLLSIQDPELAASLTVSLILIKISLRIIKYLLANSMFPNLILQISNLMNAITFHFQHRHHHQHRHHPNHCLHQHQQNHLQLSSEETFLH